MAHDRAVARLVARLFLRDNQIPSRHVQVTVKDGLVTLRGRVRTLQLREKASEIAGSLPGVHVVRNELEVAPSPVLSDASVAEDVRRSLERDSRVRKESIVVSVVDGLVTLTGTVRGYEERILAVDIVLCCEGVRTVEHSLPIDVVRGIEDATLAQRIRSALLASISEQEGQIRIAISAGRGMLSGWARSIALKCVAEEVARGFRLNELKNEIQVLP